MLEVDGEGLHFRQPARLRLAQPFMRDRGDVALQRLVQAVDDVVHPARLLEAMAVVVVERRLRAGEHLLHDVGHAKRFARRVGERHGRRLQRRLIEIERLCGIVRAGPGRQQAHQQLREPWQQADEERRHREVEGGVEIRGEPSRRRFERRQPLREDAEEGEGDRRADQPRREIAERQAELYRIAAGAFQHRVDGAADIGAEHHGERRLRAEQAGRGERHHRQHDGDARMRRPGQRRGERRG